MRSSRSLGLVLSALVALPLLAAPPAVAQAKKAAAPAAKTEAFDYAAVVKQLKARNIGPANMGGRTVDFAVPETNVSTIYAAVGPSGLWKSEDAGLNWAPSFHKEATVSVGAVAVSQSHPDIVWVGTGEATARNSVAPGDGVYKSEDAGKTWKNMGLAETRFISRIVIDPVDPDIVHVAAQGHLWGPNEDRGVYRTVDGGKTWKKVLYVNPETGACDLAIDPSNSRILYAGMWEHRRWPYFFRSGGPGSGVYRTTDGGETWAPAKDGLPSGPYGRIGLGVARSNPNVVYALVEAEGDRRGLFRSEDKGRTWRRACDRATYDQVNFRPFYYSRLTVDPTNDLVVYVYSGSCFVSRDAGKTFTQVFTGAHPDHHAVWVDPRDPKHVIDGNDGGIDISWDGGKKALGVAVAPWAEVYNIGLDMRDPYYLDVGLQDNGNWLGPSNTRERAGIFNSHWVPTGGGDGYYAQFDPVEWWIMFRNLQMGGIERHNLKTGESVGIRPEAPLGEPPYRFNWNSPIYLSRHDRNVLYFGGNFLFKSTDRGSSWTKASPDLTTNDPAKLKDSGGLTVDNTGAENHCTILTITESPLKAGRHLGRHGRRPGPGHPRRRPGLGERDREHQGLRRERQLGDPDRGLALRRRRRLSDRVAPPGRRLQALRLQERRLRQDLGLAPRRPARIRLPPHRAGRARRTGTSSSSAASSGCSSAATAGGSGSRTRAISRPWPSATSRSIRASATSSSAPTAGASGSSTTSGRSRA